MRICVVLVFIVVDFFTGILLALKNGEFTSKKMREGLYNKASEVILVALAYMISIAMRYYELPYPNAISVSICTYTVIMEIGSIMENLGNINHRLLPNIIRKVFKNIESEEDKK